MGKPHSTVIEINGKKYDARTGQLMGESTSSRTPAPKRSIDGVARPVRHSKDLHSSSHKSKTLMRHAVKKPGQKPVSVKPDEIRRSGKPNSANLSTSTHAKNYFQPKQQRVERAESVKQNSMVRRFNDIGAPQPTTQQKPTHKTYSQVQRMNPAQHPKPAHKPTTHHQSKTESVIEQGLKSAQSHKQTHHKAKKTRKRGKFASLAAASTAVFLLVGFFGFQYAPNISMRYASARSGVDANMPGYRPSGFALNSNIIYTPGQVTLTFRSNSDERQFNIVQRESAWNSESLRSNYVANIDKSMQTYEDKGRTIYIYGESNATWVDGGVWYDIQGNSQLNSDQLIRIASSM